MGATNLGVAPQRDGFWSEELVGKFFSLLGFSLDLHGIFLFISSVKRFLIKFLPKPPLQGPPYYKGKEVREEEWQQGIRCHSWVQPLAG